MADAAAQPNPTTASACKLFVGNLPADCTAEELRNFFQKYGSVADVHLMSAARSRLGNACAFVVYTAAESAQDAIQNCHHKLKLRVDMLEPLTVSIARQGGDRGPGRPAGTAGFGAAPALAQLGQHGLGAIASYPMAQGGTSTFGQQCASQPCMSSLQGGNLAAPNAYPQYMQYVQYANQCPSQLIQNISPQTGQPVAANPALGSLGVAAAPVASCGQYGLVNMPGAVTAGLPGAGGCMHQSADAQQGSPLAGLSAPGLASGNGQGLGLPLAGASGLSLGLSTEAGQAQGQLGLGQPQLETGATGAGTGVEEVAAEAPHTLGACPAEAALQSQAQAQVATEGLETSTAASVERAPAASAAAVNVASPGALLPDPRRVLVGNLPVDILSQSVEMVFSTYGRVVSVSLLPDKASSALAQAVVEYDTPQAAQTAAVTLHQRYEIRLGFGAITVQVMEQVAQPQQRNAPY